MDKLSTQATRIESLFYAAATVEVYALIAALIALLVCLVVRDLRAVWPNQRGDLPR